MAPCRELSRRGYVADWCFVKDVGQMLPTIAAGRYDTLVLPRLGFDNAEAQAQFFSSFRRASLAVVYEIDDDVFSPWIVQRQRGTVERDKSPEQLEHQRQMALAMIRAVDGVTVTTPRLAAVASAYTDRPVCVVPNAIDTNYWRQETARAVRRWHALTIGWIGGRRPGDDLRTVAEAWTRISDKHKRIEFVCTETARHIFSEYVPKARLHVLPWAGVDWTTTPDGRILPPYVHGMTNVDIGCAAVSPRIFNLMKTPIKVWEYTLAGAAVVATPTLYGTAIAHGEDGLLAESVDEWEAALERLVTDPPYRERLQKAQRRRVERDHALHSNWQHWLLAWAHIRDEARARQAGQLITA